LRIGVNASVTAGPLTGVGYYTLALLRAITKLDSGIEWVVFGLAPGLIAGSELPSSDIIELDPASRVNRIMWEQTVLPRLASSRRLDLLHCPDFSRPVLTRRVPVVNTFHDLSFKASGSFFRKHKLLYKRTMASISLRHGLAFIADSEFTKREMARLYRVEPSKIKVIHLGVDHNPVVAAASNKNGALPFILFVGTLERRKNIARLVEAFAHLKRLKGIPHSLVLAGQWGEGAREIREAITKSGLTSEISTPGYLTRAEVLTLYRDAEIVVYPSLYEGFGLPVLEAMSHGKPVACSRTTSIPEVAGDAAEYFEPTNTFDMADSLWRLVSSPTRRDVFRVRGLERVRAFTWERCAREHLDYFRTLLATSWVSD
jgi:glycosyltransferase involved in cell wall biosynthesis